MRAPGGEGRVPYHRTAEDRRNRHWLRIVTHCGEEPVIPEPVLDSAKHEWNEVEKVQHDGPRVDAMTQPMQVREKPDASLRRRWPMKEDLTMRGEQGLAGYDTILTEVAGLIDDVRRSVTRTVNIRMTVLYWLIGRRIVESEQGGKMRAGYGEELGERLSADLSARYGRGFSIRNLWHMKAFYLAWPGAQEGEIPQTPSAESGPQKTL